MLPADDPDSLDRYLWRCAIDHLPRHQQRVPVLDDAAFGGATPERAFFAYSTNYLPGMRSSLTSKQPPRSDRPRYWRSVG
jgi:hypothetical protein